MKKCLEEMEREEIYLKPYRDISIGHIFRPDGVIFSYAHRSEQFTRIEDKK